MTKALDSDEQDALINSYPPEKNANDSQSPSSLVIEDLQIGVRKFRVARSRAGAFSGLFNVRDYDAKCLPILVRLATDIVKISPHYVLVFFLWKLWSSANDALEMYLSNRLLQLVEVYLATRQMHAKQILAFGVARGLVTVLSNYFEWHGRRASVIVETRVTRHFQYLITKADISLDLVTSQEHRARHEAKAFKAYDSFANIIRFVSGVIQAVTQLALVVSVSSVAGGPSFVLLCIMHPLCGHLFKRTLFNSECITFINNPDHQRLEALNALTDGSFRQDILSNGLGDWILTQMKKAHDLLGDIPNHSVWTLLYSDDTYDNSPLPAMAVGILGELPLAFCIVNALWYPDSFSIASLAILRSSTQQLHNSVSSLLDNLEGFNRGVADVEGIYLAAETGKNIMDKGTVPYPLQTPGASVDTPVGRGMAFALRDVSFSYPGAQSGAALSNISLDIEAGSLVVLVGANGSGKSTLVRLLSRLYEPSAGSGAFLIDGLPAEDYRMGDLYRAIALLSQENRVYPLSLGENISLGATQTACEDGVHEAARLGGALEFISRFEKGMKTKLKVFDDSISHNLQGKPDHPLVQEMKRLPTDIDISGGEKQRLVASRTFMRLKLGAVRFVAVDEPTSALDAEGELHLFNNLLAARQGKTLVFVTHRFGHLTKHADKIVCMKAGQIVEVGTHAELIQKENGEYANLYKIQADAYV
ncbi:hypothetical protein D9619_011375 [Psilocybe cf. subviscida]|uniref:ABC transporter domain-containing protein n=1 Tax=Psilocybe cf. subviscida TaxID=2480587 RepID=A0A8H5F5K8_9AGAR|nr:hypothetical protein D9619_011375 [Psilocybe cf. subviscida]